MDFAASALGSVAVLIVGTVWRRRKLGEPHAKVAEAHTADRLVFAFRDKSPPGRAGRFALPSDGVSRSRRSD